MADYKNGLRKMRKKILVIGSLMMICMVGLSQQSPLKLWYNQPSAKWTDALPIGNGRLGAMIFGGVDQDRIQFNEETLWTGYPRDYNKKGAYKYLSQIRQLLFEGKQKEAEQLAGEQFMGERSDEGSRATWFKKVTDPKNLVYSRPQFDDSKWKEIQMPSYDGWEAEGLQGLDGAVWFRTSFTLPASWTGKDLILDLNRIRDQDFTYVNGKLVGAMESTEPRKYVIPKNV
ncbi:MAG TPA: glycoside hydrolase N-terminal domain-containing protein, partial [Acidobacteriota bacterium]